MIVVAPPVYPEYPLVPTMSPTRPQVAPETLITLHRIHRQLGDLRERLARGPRVIRARQANVQRLEEELHALKEEAKAFRVATDKKQLQLKTNEERLGKLQVQLNAAKSNVEYQGLKEQIAAAEMANSVLADEILESLERLDEYPRRITEAEAALEKTRGDLAAAEAEFAEEEPALRSEIARLEEELARQEEGLPAEFRIDYRRVVSARGEDGMAVVEHQSCGGCHQQIPLNAVNAIMLSQPAFCRSCGRLLFLPEDAIARTSRTS